MDFDLTPEQEELRDSVARFAAAELNHGLAEDEREGRLRREAWRAAAGFGLLGLPVPETYGGSGRDLLDTVCAMEGLGRGCRDNGLVFALSAQMWAVQMPLLHFGSEAQRARYLPGLLDGSTIGAHAMTEEGSGSDAFALRTRAVREGDVYRLRGAKTFVTNAPVADLFVVFATVDPEAGADGITAFLVERGDPGLQVSRGFQKMGLRTAPLGEVFLDDCEVPASRRLGEEGAGVALFNHSMEYERACILAANVGAMERELEVCVKRARTWQRFGKPIGSFQSVSNRVADMKLRLETARLLLYRTAWRKSQGRRTQLDSAMAKLWVSECMLASSLDAVRLFGGWGYVAETGIEQNVRDAVGGTLYSGTSDIQRMIIARMLGL